MAKGIDSLIDDDDVVGTITERKSLPEASLLDFTHRDDDLISFK